MKRRMRVNLQAAPVLLMQQAARHATPRDPGVIPKQASPAAVCSDAIRSGRITPSPALARVMHGIA